MRTTDGLTISIASKDRPDVVEATLRKLHDFGLEGCPLILCDDGSTPALDPAALRLFPRGRLLRNEIAQGQAYARNRIAEECATPFLLQLDDDSYPVFGSLSEALSIFEANDECAALALALEEPSRGRLSGRRGDGQNLALRAFVGCGCILRLTDFRKVGGYAIWLGATCEEDEFCMRLHCLGKSVLYTDLVRVRHDVTDAARDVDAICYRSYRNWSWIWLRTSPCAILPLQFCGLWMRAVVQTFRTKNFAALRGCRDGLLSPLHSPRRKPITVAKYLKYRSRPHHLNMFENAINETVTDDSVSGCDSNIVAPETRDLVSVIVPVFNRPEKVAACLNSVHAQSHRPIEVIVVDDGSTDETPLVLEELRRVWAEEGSPDFQVRVIRQSNAGAPAARNRGLREASGQWIQFLDSDDLLLPRKISNGLLEANRSNAEIVYCRAQFMDRSGGLLDRFWGRQLSGDWRDCFEFSWQTMCALYSREALERIGFWNEGLIISQDWEFCIRAVISGGVIAYQAEVGAMYMSEGADRIGSSFNREKHCGRELALWTVYEHLEQRRLICRNLRRRFRSRLLHIWISYRALGDTAFAANLLKRLAIERLLPPGLEWFLIRMPCRWLAGRIVAAFDRFQASSRSRAG